MDNNLQVIAYSLSQFVAKYLVLENTADPEDLGDYAKVANFALRGRHVHQHSISVLTNRFTPQNNPTILRDYDSVLGFASTIPLVQEIFIFSVFNPVLTLSENIHLKVPFKMNADQPAVPFRPDAIPNVAIATFKGGSRGVIRIAFPGLFQEGCSVQLSAERKANIYDDGILPALGTVIPEDLQNWSPSYQDALFRAKNKSGTFQYGTRSLSLWDVQGFGASLKEHLQAKHAWARDMVYIIQIKGVKEANRHNPTANDAQAALAVLLAGIYTTVGDWFVDVGLEVSEPGRAYQWRTDGHGLVLQHALGVTGRRAASLTNINHRHYSRDLSSHLLDLSGCRVHLTGQFRGPHKAEYAQMYTTDKAVVYHLEKGRHSKFMTGTEALKGRPPKFTEELYHAFYMARDSVDCAARIELRVPLDVAATVVLGMSPTIISQSLVVYSRKTWSWKAIRVQAISQALALQNQAPLKSRLTTHAADLTIGLTWLLAGVYSRPDDGPVGREIMLRVLPITDDYEVGNLMFPPPENRERDLPVPYCPHGVVFLTSLQWPPEAASPRLSYRDRDALGDRCYKAYFHRTYRELFYKMVQTGFDNRPAPLVRMRKGETRPHRNDQPDPLPGFQQLAIAFPEPGIDIGDDLPLEEVIFPEPQEDTTQRATKLWLRFLMDIMQKCGNEKHGGSYCLLDMEERESVTPETFQDMDLSRVFSKVQWRRPAPDELIKVFGMFWPNKGHVLSRSAQGFKQMRYYVEWKTLCSEMPAEDVNKFRRTLFQQFSALNWVPAARNNRIWSYEPDSTFYRLPSNLPSNTRAPRIFVLNNAEITWDRQQEDDEHEIAVEQPPSQGLEGQYQTRRMDLYEDLRQEEEESSDDGSFD